MARISGRILACLAILVTQTVVAAGGDPAVPTLGIPGATTPIAGLLSTAQPTPEQIEAASRAGFRTVINLRADTEEGFAWEQQAVLGLGMRYVRIPVTGADALTRETVSRFDAALEAGLAEGPVLLHCASGNRNGALLALREAWVLGTPPEAALEVGLRGGLTRLEPAVREKLGMVPAAAAAPAP